MLIRMNILRKIIVCFFVRFRILKYRILSDCTTVIGKPFLFYPVLLRGKGKIVFGSPVRLGVELSPNFHTGYGYIEARSGNSEIVFGNNVRLNNGFSVVAVKKIEIGNDVLVGLNFMVSDSDFHHLEAEKRFEENPPSAEVKIGNNVFIGNNVTILKGVTICDNTVIGSNSVVSSSIPENVIAVGNPAKVIRNL